MSETDTVRDCAGRVICEPLAGLIGSVDAHPTGDQQVAGSIPIGPETFFRGDRSGNICYSDSLPSADSRRAVVSFWQKNVHKYWLTRIKPAQEKVWLGKLTGLDMTLMG